MDGAWLQPQLFLRTHLSRIVGSEGLCTREPWAELQDNPQDNATAPPALLDASPESAMESEMNREQTERAGGSQESSVNSWGCSNVWRKTSAERGQRGKAGVGLGYHLNDTSLISMAFSLHSLNKSCVSVDALNNLCWFVEIGITKSSLDWGTTGLVCLV